MSETSHSSSEPQCPNIVDLALSVNFDGYAHIFVDFMKEMRNADQKTPEEIEKTKAAFDARLTAFKRDESKRLFEGILSVVKREVSLARSQNIWTENSAQVTEKQAIEVMTGFMDTIFKEGAHNWSPEEREKRVDACLAEVASIQRGAERKRDNNASRRLSFNFDGYTNILRDFTEQIKDLPDDWSPEEIDKRKKACSDKLDAYKKAESTRILEEISHDFREIDEASRTHPQPKRPDHSRTKENDRQTACKNRR